MRSALALAAIVALVLADSPIKKVIVLMEENRSFDHMLGFYKRTRPDINGLTGSEFNYEKVGNTSSKKFYVTDDAPDEGPWDPDHSLHATTFKIFGSNNQSGKETMGGFADYESQHHESPKYVFQMFNETGVPVMQALTDEFALFDEWYCSVPGPTFPNRMYAYSGTSHGAIDDDVEGMYPQADIFNELEKNGKTWAVYYEEIPAQWLLLRLREPAALLHFYPMEMFYVHLKEGTLPDFVYLEPAYFGSNDACTDQHPDHSVSNGERLYKKIYEAVRNSTHWNEMAFIITYDEHGGFYDHVTPPTEGIPNPDGIDGGSFKFDRLGIRIPHLVISPWIEKGTLVHGPPAAQKPQSTSAYDATSVYSTVLKLWGIENAFLTKRDAWAATFEQIFSRTTPRTDCPYVLPDAHPQTKEAKQAERRRVPTSLQEHFVILAGQLTGAIPPTFDTQQAAGEWVVERVAEFMKTAA